MTPLDEYEFEDISWWTFDDFPELLSDLAAGTYNDILNNIIDGIYAKDDKSVCSVTQKLPKLQGVS